MAIRQKIYYCSKKTAAMFLWLLFILFFFQIQISYGQQFVNGKLIYKRKVPGFSMYFAYYKFSQKYLDIYSQTGCPFTNFDNTYEIDVLGLDTLKHEYCCNFVISQNRESLGGPFARDSSSSVHINFNGDTLADFGFSLKLNSPLLKDSIYVLTFLTTSFDAFNRGQKFYNKNLFPYEDFKIVVTQSNSPNEESQVVAVIKRPDVFEKDTSAFSHYCVYPTSSTYFNEDDYFYRVRKQIKGVNNGQYLTIKAKLVVTDAVSSAFRGNFKPSVVSCSNCDELNKGLNATSFELRCPFKIKQKGTLCSESDPLILSSNNNHPTDKYLWSNGDTTPTIKIKLPGIYWLKKSRNGCDWTDSLTVQEIERSNAPVSVYKCRDSSIVLGKDSIQGENSFKWDNGIDSTHINVNATGVYVRQSLLNGCKWLDTFKVLQYVEHKSVSSKTVIVCQNDSTVLRGLANKHEWYRHDDLFSTLNEITIKGLKDDTVVLRSLKNCWQLDTITIRNIQCQINIKDLIFIPYAFSPNGDGINDKFFINSPLIKELEVSIYNRWGELIYYSENVSDAWDGKYQDEYVQDGIYLLCIKIKSGDVPQLHTPITFIYSKLSVLR